jgi:hypothetical protein
MPACRASRSRHRLRCPLPLCRPRLGPSDQAILACPRSSGRWQCGPVTLLNPLAAAQSVVGSPALAAGHALGLEPGWRCRRRLAQRSQLRLQQKHEGRRFCNRRPSLGEIVPDYFFSSAIALANDSGA